MPQLIAVFRTYAFPLKVPLISGGFAWGSLLTRNTQAKTVSLRISPIGS